MERHRVITALVIVLLCTGICFAKSPGEETATTPAQTKMLDDARAKFDKADYAGARQEIARLLQTSPSSPLCPEAQYLMATSYMREGNETAARQELERLLKNYPNCSRVTEASATLRSLEAKRFQELYAAQQHKAEVVEEQNKNMAASVEAMRRTAKNDKIYIVIDIQADMLMVKQGSTTLYSFPCATGKGMGVLAATGGLEKFYTPRGRHTIIKKEKDPVWVRPNWYWLERGLEVPQGITIDERKVHGHLGKYKLDIGEAFYIHGYTGVVKPGKYTHGCIRVNEADLQMLWDLTELGTEVYIF